MIKYYLLLILLTLPLYPREKVDDFDLMELLDTKISTASQIEEQALNAPLSVVTITKEKIALFGYETINEVLQDAPGFFSRTDMFYDYAGVRGVERLSSYGGSITLLINGHKINEVVFDAAFYGVDRFLNLKNVERIEIVKGPVSAMYGTGSMLAAVNIITKDPVRNTGGGLDFTYGSLEKKRLQGYYNAAFGDVAISVNGAMSDSDGDDPYFPEYDSPENNNGIAENLDWEKYWGLYSTIEWKDFEFSFFWGNRNKGIPTAAWFTDFNNPNLSYRDRKYFTELKYKKQIFPNLNLDVEAGFDDYFYKGVYPYFEDDYVDYYDSGTGRVFSASTDLTWDINSANRLVGGVEYLDIFKNDYRLWMTGEEFLYADYPYKLVSLFAEDSWQLYENLKLMSGLRYDIYSKDENSFSPRFTLVYNPFENSSIKLIYGQAYRIPNIYERFYFEEGKSKPNPNLKPEKIKSAELRFEKIFFNNFIVDLGFFHNWIDDFINQAMDHRDNLAQFVNKESFEMQGLELIFIVKASDMTSVDLNYTYNISSKKNGQNLVLNMPDHIFKLAFSHNPFKNLLVSANLYYETSRETFAMKETGDYYLLNLYTAYKIPIENSIIKDFHISFKVRNLLDLKYKLPAGNEHLQEMLPQRGREIRLSAGIRL